MRVDLASSYTLDLNYDPAFPAASYTIQLVTSTNGMWVGQFDSVQFKIVTAENVTMVSASGNIAG
jgi:hypothetical protein